MDVLVAGAGNDLLIAGVGNDTIQFMEANSGSDTVQDFTDNADRFAFNVATTGVDAVERVGGHRRRIHPRCRPPGRAASFS